MAGSARPMPFSRCSAARRPRASVRAANTFSVSNNKATGRANNQVSSYDLYAPGWATPPDTEFTGQDKYPFVAGEFV